MYTELFLEGNGAGTVAALGALDALISAGVVSPAPRVVCFSMGSVIAVGLALGSSPAQILEVIAASPLAGSTNTHLVLRMMTWRGRAFTMRAIRAIVVALGVTGKMTFADLRAATGWDMCVLVASLSTRRTYTISEATAPTAPVLDTIIASCAIPGMMNTGALVDGGTFGGFADALGLAPGPDSLVIVTKICRIYNPRLNPAMRLLASYRMLMYKLGSRWLHEAQRAGATVIHVPHGCGVTATAAHIRRIFGTSREWATARASAAEDGKDEGAAVL
jgi:predicted acylesterase/phospholipase RssA